MHMVRRDYTGDNIGSFFRAYAANQFLGTMANGSGQDMIAVFGDPAQVNLQAKDRMGGFTILTGHAFIVSY